MSHTPPVLAGRSASPRGSSSAAFAQSDPSDVDVVMHATRVIGGLIAEPLAHLQPAVTAPQWRVLVLASVDGCDVSTIAEDLAVHPSNATRLCDRLVSAGLLHRQREPGDRRRVRLRLTPKGRRLVSRAMKLRRQRVEHAMAQMTPKHRAALAQAVAEFADALATDHENIRGQRP